MARSARTPAPVARIDTLVDDKARRLPCMPRDDLGSGAKLSGPLIVVELSSTSYVAPDFAMRVDDYGNLHLEMRA